MRARSLILVATVLLVLSGAAGGVYAYDQARADQIAPGVQVGGIALGGLALPAASGGAESVVRPARARLSLNENPFGPSPFALAAIRNQLGEVCRYVDDGVEAILKGSYLASGGQA